MYEIGPGGLRGRETIERKGEVQGDGKGRNWASGGVIGEGLARMGDKGPAQAVHNSKIFPLRVFTLGDRRGGGGIPRPPIGTLVYPPARRSSKCKSVIRRCTGQTNPGVVWQHAASSSNIHPTSIQHPSNITSNILYFQLKTK